MTENTENTENTETASLTFDEPYDWGFVLVNESQTFEVTYTIVVPPAPEPEPECECPDTGESGGDGEGTGEGTGGEEEHVPGPGVGLVTVEIVNDVLTLVSDPESAEIVTIDSPNVTILPTSDWISPDLIKFQNAAYPAYEGDTSNQKEALSVDNVINNYSNTLLYCFGFDIDPTERAGSITATVNYTIKTTTAGDPEATPPVPDEIVETQETLEQIYTFTGKKDIASAQASLEQLVSIGVSNQDNLNT